MLIRDSGHVDGMAGRRSEVLTQSVGLPPPFQSEQFCSVTVVDGAYVTPQQSVRARRRHTGELRSDNGDIIPMTDIHWLAALAVGSTLAVLGAIFIHTSTSAFQVAIDLLR